MLYEVITIVGLLGPSGGGKTTLMRSVVGAQIVAGGPMPMQRRLPKRGFKNIFSYHFV